MRNPFRGLKKREWLLWGISLTVVLMCNILARQASWVTRLGAMVGVTALIFVARGDVWGQILTVVFSLLYGVTSWQFRYYGEMITYLGMTMPIAALSVVTWLRHPYKEDGSEVEIHRLSVGQRMRMILLTVLVTVLFYFVLRALDTPNLFFSALSVTTSFLASYLTLYRNSWYAVAYAANDVVLMILWVLASLTDPGYIPMVTCFGMFLVNDLYGFFSWKRREKEQRIGN